MTPWYETYVAIQWAEIWSSLGTWVNAVKPDLGTRTRQNFELARTADRLGVGEAVRRRERYFRKLHDFLGARDLLVLPTVPAPAPNKGSLEMNRTKGTYYPRVLSLTAVAGIARLPQVTLPLAQVVGLPVGLSFLAAFGEDAFLLSAVRAWTTMAET